MKTRFDRSLSISVSVISMFPYRSVINRLSKQENRSTDEPCSLSSNNSLVTCFYPLLIYYLIPLSIIVLFYSKLIVHVRRTSTNLFRHNVRLFHFRRSIEFVFSLRSSDRRARLVAQRRTFTDNEFIGHFSG